jgi:hypothetical protein
LLIVLVVCENRRGAGMQLKARKGGRARWFVDVRVMAVQRRGDVSSVLLSRADMILYMYVGAERDDFKD